MEPSPSDAARPPAPRARLRWPHWLLAVLLAVDAITVARYGGVCAGGSDSSGYLNNARLLEAGRATIPMRTVPGIAPATLPPYTYVPLGFIPNADRVTMTPTYPMGLPILLLAGSRIVGWALAPPWVIGLHALAGLVLVFLLCRRAGLEPGWALTGVLILAVSPLYLQYSVQLMSDVPALVWVTAAVCLAWTDDRRTGAALAAGLCLGIAVLVRPSNLLAIVPVLIALGLCPRRIVALMAGGLPPAIFLALFNHAAYGRILTTGYGAVGPEFGSAHVPATLLHYAVWIPVVLTPVVALALGLPALAGRRSDAALVLLSWILMFFGFYAFYRHTHSAWWALRFVLPAFPALIAGSLLVGRALAARFALGRRPWLASVAVAGILVYGISWTCHFRVDRAGSGERIYPLVTTWVTEHLPANATVAAMQASGSLFYYTPLTVFRWDMMSPADCERLARASLAAGRPVYAVLFPFEMDDPEWAAFTKHLPGRWTQIGAVRGVTIWRYLPESRS